MALDIVAIVAGQPVDDAINANVAGLRGYQAAGGKYAARVYSGANGALDQALRERYPAALLDLLGLSYSDLITLAVSGQETPNQAIVRLAQLAQLLPYDTAVSPTADEVAAPVAA